MLDIMDFANRINLIIKTLYAGNKSKFANAIGVPEANIRSYLSGTSPKLDVLEKIVSICEISCDWLLTGNGPMLRSAASVVAGGDVLQQTGDVVIGKGNIIGADAQQMQSLQEQIARQEREIEELRRDKELLRAVVSGMMGQK